MKTAQKRTFPKVWILWFLGGNFGHFYFGFSLLLKSVRIVHLNSREFKREFLILKVKGFLKSHYLSINKQLESSQLLRDRLVEKRDLLFNTNPL